jgi:uncharacterized membrane protein YdjX (TVP38/TMEM64 family)
LYSWIGVTLGGAALFLLARKYGAFITHFLDKRSPRGRSFLDWIQRRGFTPLFIVSCIPFTPSFLVNIIAGLTTIPMRVFLIAIICGKAIMIFFVSYIGYDLLVLFTKPIKLIIVTIFISLFWVIGRMISRRYYI